MSQIELQDVQWLASLPRVLDFDRDQLFWQQPDEAKAWLSQDEAIATAVDNILSVNDNTSDAARELRTQECISALTATLFISCVWGTAFLQWAC